MEMFVTVVILAIAGIQAGERRWKNAIIASLIAAGYFIVGGLLHANSMLQARNHGLMMQVEKLQKKLQDLGGSNNADAENPRSRSGL